MRKLLLIAAFVAASLATPAFAADLPMKAAPVVTPHWNWTGLYVGAHFGGAFGNQKGSEVDGTNVISAEATGFLGGLQAGYNVQTDWVVWGIEGDFSAADVTAGSNVCPCYGTITTKSDWTSTITGRVGGVVLDRILVYAKGGVAWVHNRYGVSCYLGACAGSSPSDTRTGWTAGFGTEYAFTPHWSAKFEYDYMDFGTSAPSFTCTEISIGACNNATTMSVKFVQTINVVKAGLNYKF
jgi:outer membrane immunogenic protein